MKKSIFLTDWNCAYLCFNTSQFSCETPLYKYHISHSISGLLQKRSRPEVIVGGQKIHGTCKNQKHIEQINLTEHYLKVLKFVPKSSYWERHSWLQRSFSLYLLIIIIARLYKADKQ